MSGGGYGKRSFIHGCRCHVPTVPERLPDFTHPDGTRYFRSADGTRIVPYVERDAPRTPGMNRGARKRAAAGQLPGPSRHQTFLNVTTFRDLMADHGKTTIAGIADELGVGAGTIHRALSGGALSGEFIGALTNWLRSRDHGAGRPTLDDLLTPTQRAAA